MNAKDRLDKVLDILMRDYEAIRAEIRAAETRHEKTSFWLSSGLLVALSLCFKEEFRMGFAFLPLVILAYWAHRLYSHTLHIATLSQWVMRTEELIDKFLKTNGLLDWERHFVRTTLKSFSLFSFTPHGIIEAFLMLPSLVAFVLAVLLGPAPVVDMFEIDIVLARVIIWVGYPLLAFVLVAVYFMLSKSTKVLEDARLISIEKVFNSVVGPQDTQSVTK